jgi:23S rRNA (adenine2503-C2)-methyltransferase
VTPLAGLLPDGIASALGLEPNFRGRQVFRWIHRGVESFAGMSDLPAALRSTLDERARILTSRVETRSASEDGSVKLRIRLHDGAAIEAMSLQDGRGRRTACLSTQAGCGMGCAFCRTGLMGLARNLAAHEIVEQLLHLRRETGDVGTIVFMGMGEPLLNYDNVMKALRLMTDPLGMAISTRRITLSTSGIVPALERLAQEDLVPNLAISLNATTDVVRDRLIPINRKWNIAALLEACRRFPLEPRRRITFEYVLIQGVNDSPDDALRLVRLLKGVKKKVNLIPLNADPLIPLKPPGEESVLAFQQILLDHHLTAYIRRPRGEDVSAACGMLAARDIPKNNHKDLEDLKEDNSIS